MNWSTKEKHTVVLNSAEEKKRHWLTKQKSKELVIFNKDVIRLMRLLLEGNDWLIRPKWTKGDFNDVFGRKNDGTNRGTPLIEMKTPLGMAVFSELIEVRVSLTKFSTRRFVTLSILEGFTKCSWVWSSLLGVSMYFYACLPLPRGFCPLPINCAKFEFFLEFFIKVSDQWPILFPFPALDGCNQKIFKMLPYTVRQIPWSGVHAL
jgi:hypothetical protein